MPRLWSQLCSVEHQDLSGTVGEDVLDIVLRFSCCEEVLTELPVDCVLRSDPMSSRPCVPSLYIADRYELNRICCIAQISVRSTRKRKKADKKGDRRHTLL